MAIGRYRWPIAAAWRAAVLATSAAYDLAPEALTAPSRGLTGARYAAIGRHVGLHKDTVQSHCTRMRAALADDVELEERAEGLRVTVTASLAAQARRMKNGASSDAEPGSRKRDRFSNAA